MTLRVNGLDNTLADIFYLAQHGPGVDEILPYLGLDNFASKIRAKIQLTQLYTKFNTLNVNTESTVSNQQKTDTVLS